MAVYLRYFFYLASNWNIRIAYHILRNEIKGEKKYNIHTTGADSLRRLSKKGIDTSHATFYMAASYDLLEKLYEIADLRQKEHFIDIGCGKGRALCVAAYYQVNKLTGIDFSSEFCKDASKNLLSTKERFPDLSYTISCTDAFYFEFPPDADCIFLFNPFDEVILSGVVKNLEESIEMAPRDITVIYVNPVHKELFSDYGYEEVFHTRAFRYLEGSIFKKPRKNRA